MTLRTVAWIQFIHSVNNILVSIIYEHQDPQETQSCNIAFGSYVYSNLEQGLNFCTCSILEKYNNFTTLCQRMYLKLAFSHLDRKVGDHQMRGSASIRPTRKSVSWVCRGTVIGLATV